MALTFLPAEHIVPSFIVLAEKEIAVETTLAKLVAYVRSTWITISLWSPGQWFVFCETAYQQRRRRVAPPILPTGGSTIQGVSYRRRSSFSGRRAQAVTVSETDIQGRARTPARPLG